jgi:hypothetical protein
MIVRDGAKPIHTAVFSHPAFLDRAFLTAPARRTAARRRTNHPVGRAVRLSIGLGMVNSAITAEISSHAAINRAATSIA